jgi:hypothetical protein
LSFPPIYIDDKDLNGEQNPTSAGSSFRFHIADSWITRSLPDKNAGDNAKDHFPARKMVEPGL